MIETYGTTLLPPKGGRVSQTGPALYHRGEIGLWMVLDRLQVQRALGAEHGAAQLDLLDSYLLTQRNHDFLQAIQGELAEGGVVIAVGAFHLPGTEGMVELIRGEGYTVTRIPVGDETQ